MFSDARATLARLGDLLSAEESSPLPPPSALDPHAAVEVADGSLCWGDGGKGEKEANSGETGLRGVDMALVGRKLMMVVGPVGGGKSLLLAALIGDAQVPNYGCE